MQLHGHLHMAAQTDPRAAARWHLEADLGERLINCSARLSSLGMPWIGVARPIEAAAPPVREGRAAVDSAVIRGDVLGAHCAGGYPSEEAMKRHCAARYNHVPDLKLTAMIRAGGKPLFRGAASRIRRGGRNSRSVARTASGEGVAGMDR